MDSDTEDHSDASNELHQRQRRRRDGDGFFVHVNGDSVFIPSNCPLPVKTPSFLGGNREANDEIRPATASGLNLNASPPTGLAVLEFQTAAEAITGLNQYFANIRAGMGNPSFGTVDAFAANFQVIVGTPFNEVLNCTVEQRDAMVARMTALAVGWHELMRSLYWSIQAAVTKFREEFIVEAEQMRKELEMLYRMVYRVVRMALDAMSLNDQDREQRQDPFMPLPYELLHDPIKDTKNELLVMKNMLRDVASRQRLRRVATDVMEPVYVRGVFAYAYRRRSSVSEWVIAELGDPLNSWGGRAIFDAFEGLRGHASDVIKYFETRGGLKDLQYSRYMMSFTNGVLFLETNRFVPLAAMNDDLLPAPYTYSCVFHNNEFNCVSPPMGCDVEIPFPEPDDPNATGPSRRGTIWDLPTPAFDRIMNSQRWPYNVKVANWIVFGRLMYDQGYLDNEQSCPFYEGRRETGKSTFTRVAQMLYPSFMVGSFAAHGETTFGLQHFLNKVLLVQPEVREDWNLDPSSFLRMISSDTVNVAVKFGTPRDIVWRSPLVMAGNEFMRWIDDHAAFARRLFLFRFTEKVNKDTTLLRQLHQELPNIIRKASTFYLAAVHRWHDGIPWPQYFRETRCEYLRETSPIFNYITGRQLVRRDDYYVPFGDVIKDFLSENHGSSMPKAKLSRNINTWRIALQDEGLDITMAMERRVYPRSSTTTVEDYYVVGCDKRMQVEISTGG